MSIPLPWRPIVARWPVAAREAFGLLANKYADSGHAFPEDERLAFDAIRSRVESGEFPPDPDPVAPVPPPLPPQPPGRRFAPRRPAGPSLFGET